jgi:mercuric reductase
MAARHQSQYCPGSTLRLPRVRVGAETLFNLEEQPEHLIVLRPGYIAVEIAQAYNRFGTRVTLLHRSERILRTQTADITDELTTHFRNEGIDIHTNVKNEKFARNGKTVKTHTDKGTFVRGHIFWLLQEPSPIPTEWL